MKLNPTRYMKTLLKKGIRKARKHEVPPQGTFYYLFDKFTRNFKYQVEYVHDYRSNAKPYVAVFAFKNPHDITCRSSDFHIYQEV